MIKNILAALRGAVVLSSLFGLSPFAFAQVAIEIDANAEIREISPYLYGRNNSFSSTDPNWTLPEEDLVRLRDAGVRFFRESGGNNSSKYNWRRKLGSHPDWYNNVYTNNWDQAAQTLQRHFPNAQGMWAFPLLGYAAKTNAANFADWQYNQSRWWEGVNQNLAGNGVPNATGTKAKKEGDINLYLEEWGADSSVAILDHWFEANGAGLKRESIRYWNMDNEPEIWSGTHDDVMPTQISPQEFMQRYITLAKKARAKYPDIKLVGPVTANEWQWYNWDGKTITENGKTYPWLEYFIKTLAEEQQKSGVRLLDVLDIHFYPSTKKTEEVVQLHRVFFDRNYNFPEANGVKTINGGYDNSITKEYVFGRCNDWLNQYMGAEHGVTLGLTETGIDDSISPSVAAVWYASTMGEFMKNGVEIFTPWSWKTGMWEVLHLMTRYNQTHSVKATSANETLVSAYPTLNAAKDSLTVVLVNRSPDQSQTVNVSFSNFLPSQEKTVAYILSGLPSAETFYSDTRNALKKSDVTVNGKVLNLLLPAMSLTSVVLKNGGEILGIEPDLSSELLVFPNPTWDHITVKWGNREFQKIEIIDQNGKGIFTKNLQKTQQQITLHQQLSSGTYLIRLTGTNGTPLVKQIMAR
ncbi:glycoside hydrolase family 44 protein [Dyadobacter sp. CY323]|uniref:glycoside hydrolase family 44 protein n=1 Tax=Dyadobacter sp. CY323 TaxID=2907302 RepID=UPI001F2E568B|nr:glycoside hydrolase family 44 protein [Dyadobacter sp. CY323]MCE6988745.1 T9SS type A sorting domain-containing protein [Dyadobacter sp. CY323]